MGRFLFIGGDKRMIYAAREVARRYDTAAFGLSGEFPAPEGLYENIVLPLPFSRGGALITAPLCSEPIALDKFADFAAEHAVIYSGGSSAVLEAFCADSGFTLKNYHADESLALKNAFLTAEAAAALLIQNRECSLRGASVLITGYGRIARYLAGILCGFGAEVVVYARRAEQRTLAELDGFCAVDGGCLCGAAITSDIIVNTAPAVLFNESCLRSLRKGAVFMELASVPAEPLAGIVKSCGGTHIMASGLPGRFFPQSAGEAIAEYLTAGSAIT